MPPAAPLYQGAGDGGAGRTHWRVGDRVRVYRAQGGGGRVVPSSDEGVGEPADPRDYDVDHYARVLRDTYAARLARALAPSDFAAVFADPDQLSLFAPPTAAMRPVLTARAGLPGDPVGGTAALSVAPCSPGGAR